MDKGVYQMKLLNVMGQAVFTQAVMHNGGSAAMAISLGKSIAKGYYRLEVIKPDNSKTVKALYITE